jgi:hypothetical protein
MAGRQAIFTRDSGDETYDSSTGDTHKPTAPMIRANRP